MTDTATERTLLLTSRPVSQVMTVTPLSIPATATAREAVKILSDHRFSATPVIDNAGRPVGVISRTDLVNRLMRGDHLCSLEENWFNCASIIGKEALDNGSYLAQNMDNITVGEIMTPAIICVSTHDSIEKAVELLLKKEVHRLFVVDDAGVLVGVLSPFDVLRHLSTKSTDV